MMATYTVGIGDPAALEVAVTDRAEDRPVRITVTSNVTDLALLYLSDEAAAWVRDQLTALPWCSACGKELEYLDGLCANCGGPDALDTYEQGREH